jgi:serpin B
MCALGCGAQPEGEVMQKPAENPPPRGEVEETASPGESGDYAAAAESCNGFGINLFQYLAGEEDGNLCVSPLSVAAALTMTYAGARGDTAGEMADVLQIKGDTEAVHAAYGALMKTLTHKGEGKDVLDIANALWPQRGYAFRKAYIDLVRKEYQAGLEELDYTSDPEGCRKTINEWVARKTHDKIEELLGAGTITPATALVLTNAVYFAGTWVHAFPEEATRPMPFHVGGGDPVDVPTMSGKATYGYFEDDAVQVLEMDYKSGELSMVVVLPRERDGLADLDLTPSRLDAMVDGLNPREVQVFVPKFTMEQSFSLAEVLAGMGMPTAFTAQADFTGMAEKRELFISAVEHETYIKVDEEGTEAAAATAVVVTRTSAAVGPRPPVFKADHPFVYLIRHKVSGAILFLGRVVEPSAE